MLTRHVLGRRNTMRCLACGAEMLLLGVSLADTPMAGFERHTFKCSSCSHISRRLVLSHPRSPGANLPVVAQPSEPLVAKLQMKRVAAESSPAKLAEKLRNRRVGALDRAARARTSTWAEAVEKLRRKQAALKEQAEVASRTQPDEPVLAPAAPSGRPTKPAPLNSPTASRWSRRDL